MNNINDIRRNDNNFKFVDTIGEFINNIQFKRGYNEYLLGKNNQYSYLWNALSAIGEDYADIIYDNVLNYLDNVSNVDLCKIKALLSMINIVGLQYDVLDSFLTIPVELANLMDILSINRSYILLSPKFSETFIAALSSEDVIKHSDLTNKTQLSAEVIDNYKVDVYNDYVSEEGYKRFLLALYQFILNKYVKLQYADAENDLSSTHLFIYEYIQNDILNNQNINTHIDLSDYLKKMSQLKIKYGINGSFNQSVIVDNIENGYDSIDNYNVYERELIKEEILYRELTYSYLKAYRTSEEKFLGYNLTRYSYYREKKVKEYFSYIENTYNNMIIESNIRSIIDNTSNDKITVYDKDHNYFDIKQDNRETLLKYDPATKTVYLLTNQINAIALLLVELTLEIADIRDQIKILIRKSYMRGTFLLISYVINEFLKYGILKKYGDYFSTDEGITLGDILSASFNNDNILLIEYYDNTEYFNITTPYDVSALNSETVNDKFWDNFYNKIGVDTLDIPLDEIENFYLNQLKLKHNKVDDVVNFLSIIYEYGANNSFIGRKNGEFTCKLHDGRLIGDPYREISDIKNEILSIETINNTIDTYVERGYVLSVTEISSQLSALTDFVSSYYWTEISNANESLKEETYAEYEKNLESFNTIAESLNAISVRYDELKDNSKYRYYIDDYIEPTNPKPFFIEKVLNFIMSCDNEFIWTNIGLSHDLTSLSNRYVTLSNYLYNKLFALSVWNLGSDNGNEYEYWPYYSPTYDDELTTVTNALKNFLVGLAQIQNDMAMQHIQNHYNKLLSYKDEINRILEDCNTADSKYNAYKTAVEIATGYSFNDVIPTPSVPGCTCPLAWPVWGDPVFKIKVEDIKVDTDDGGYYHDISYITTDNLIGFIIDLVPFSSSPTIDEDSDTINEKLEKIKLRCNYTTYASYLRRNNALVAVGINHGWEHPEIAPYTYHTAETVKNKEYSGDDEDGKPEYEYVYDYYYIPHYEVTDGIAYDSNSKLKPWQEHYSLDVHDDILRLLNDAVDNLTATIELINSELQCIGYQNINLTSIDVDNVRDNTKDAYEQLISRINNFDNIINAGNEPNGWPSLNSDHNLDPFRQRLDRIKAINLSTSIAYNISWVNDEFNRINLSVLRLMLDDPDYFENYSHNAADRLDNLITSISNYMITLDKLAKEDVLSAINNISVDYNTLLTEFDSLMPTIKRDIVESILDNYTYNINYILYSDEIYSDISDAYNTPPYLPTRRYKKCLDYLLSGNYLDIGYDKTKQLSGILNWIEICAYNGFEDTAVSTIHNKIPLLKDYIDMINLIDLAEKKYLYNSLNETTLIPDKLDEIISGLNYDISYISSQIPHYNAQKEIYLKYNGTQIGYDPFYNYKNLAYSSYQIHPYLYNFVEKSNLIYPLANNFFIAFTETYEKELYEKTIDTIIGKYGNIKDLWRSGMFDWTSYQSLYEKRGSLLAETSKNPIMGFTGLFYQPALEAFLEDPETFMQDVLDDVISSYYHHLNLGIDASNRIVDQLTAYYDAIKELVLYNSSTPSLSNEFDIYKYAEDANGNSLFLLKSYKHLYAEHANDENYVPSYNEKKNTLGELWMRIKDHPFAFPAFDIRSGNEDISQYNIEENTISNGKPLNQYIFDISEYFSKCSVEILGYTLDLVSTTDKWAKQKQYIRCFFDFELSPSNRSILLNVPYKTGTNSRKIMLENVKNRLSSISQLRYANSSILVAYLEDGGLDNSNVHIYNFTSLYTTTDDININIDNIANPSMLIGNNLAMSMNSDNTNSSDFYEFVGFASNTIYVYAIFALKSGYMALNSYNTLALYHSFKIIAKNEYIPYLRLRVVAYRLGNKLITSTIASDALKYDIYNVYRDNNVNQNNKESYINAANIVLAANNTGVTIAFLTERISPTKNNKYLNNSTIVNFAEYSSMTEKYTVLDEAGLDKNYPTSTALIQTTDSDRINIYNSFDSFVQHLVNVTFEYNGNRLRYKNTKYFNLNSDIGYLPQYPDTFGKTNLFNNVALSSKNEYAIELLGPEKSDIPFTPIIKDNTDEKYGRVVEDYKEFNKIIGYNDANLSIEKNHKVHEYVFELRSMFPPDEWNTLTATPDLLRYKYILYNTKYEARPIAKGNLSDDLPNGYYYQWEEKYDLLSGEELLGPNQTSYQNVAMTNHIDNISALLLSVEFDSNTLLPNNVHLSCVVRTAVSEQQIIPANTFRLMVYAKNNVKSYEYYHLFENASKNAIHDTITYDEEWRINFNEISSLSDYVIPGTEKLPFKNQNMHARKPNELSAMLEFKYSETENINREFPYLDASDVEDEIIIVLNDTQSIYYTSLDNNKSIERGIIKIEIYDSQEKRYIFRTLNTSLPKYNDFYDRALRIETTYNLEKINADDPNSDYEIVMYFNYKNFTNPSYIKFTKNSDGVPPTGVIYDPIDKEILHTYLMLKPGESGKLDLRIDYAYYAKINEYDISESIVGCHSLIIKTYYIMNVSDDKPKFIISRIPFGISQSYITETDNYELKDSYQLGMAFRYIMLIVISTRMHPTLSLANSIVAIGKIKFKTADNTYFNYPSNATAYIEGAGATIIQPNDPARLLDNDDLHYFSASNCDFNASPLSIVIDLHELIFDVQQYKYWEWYNSPYSNSHSGYMPDEFMIAFSNDKHRWYIGDAVNDTLKILPTTNYYKAYPYGSWTGELKIEA